jgi:hypothetical protein
MYLQVLSQLTFSFNNLKLYVNEILSILWQCVIYTAGSGYILLDLDKDRWRALVNVVMNLWVP